MVDREHVRRTFAEAVGPRAVRWADSKTSLGDWEGRDWTLEVFDVPSAEKRELHKRLFPIIEEVALRDDVRVVLIFHTPEATAKYYGWVHAESGSVAG
jgi:hypothetical protein